MIYIPKYEKEYDGRTRKIILGKTKKGNDAFIIHRKYGVSSIIGISRSGKTNIIKGVIAEVANLGRRVIIFDPYKDYQDIDELNFESEDPLSVPNLEKIPHFTFPISEFREVDWLTLGFYTLQQDAVYTLNDLGYRKDLHQDDTHKFLEILKNLPTTETEKWQFYEEYGVESQEFHPFTKRALKKKFEGLCGRMFYDPLGEVPYLDAEILREKALKHNLVFDLSNFLSGKQKNLRQMQTYVGMILRAFRPILSIIKPYINFEEYDKLCPLEEFNLSSIEEISDYTLKLQRFGVNINAISQNEHLINPLVMENCHQMIKGKVRYRDEISDKLTFRDYAGIREFAVVDENGDPIVFDPYLSSCGTK